MGEADAVVQADLAGRGALPGGEGEQSAGDVAAAAAGPPREAGLLDLPDDLLRLVAGRVSPYVSDQQVLVDVSAATHLPLLLTCRKLATIGYSAVTEVRITGSDWVDPTDPMSDDESVEEAADADADADAEAAGEPPPPPTIASLLASPPGQHMRRRLFSVLSFLRRVAPSPVRRLVVCDVAINEGAYAVFWAMLRGATAHLPIRDVRAGGSAVAAVAAADVSAVPLTCLHLERLDARSEDHAAGVVAALAAHGPGLKELRLDTYIYGPSGEEDADYTAGFASKVLRDLPAMPVLRVLILCTSLCGEAARRLAAACPAVETLVLEEDCGWLPANSGVCWSLPGAFPNLRSLTWESSWDNPDAGTQTDLLLTLRGRSLERLNFAPYLNVYGSDDWVLGPPLVAALTSAAALPAVLELSGTGAWTGELLRQLLDTGAADTSTLRDLSLEVVDLLAETVAPLGRLPRLSRLSLTAGPTVSGGVSVPASPCLADLSVSPVVDTNEMEGFLTSAGGAAAAGAPPGGDTREELPAALLHAAAASPARATLATLKVHSRKPPTRAVDAAAVAVAPRLPALRHLTVGGAAWSFASGRVVAHVEPDPDPPVRVRNVLPPC